MSGSNTLSKLLDAAIEAARMEALNELQVLDTLPEQSFDDLVWIASRMCGTPIALVNLVDDRRQWCKAKHGLDAQELPRDAAFCAHAIGSDEIMEVEDTLQDARFVTSPLVTGAPFIRFYAGAPLIAQNGHRFGTLCVMDTQPRRLNDEQAEALRRLARRASDKMTSRSHQIVAQARERTMAQLLESLPGAVVACDALGKLTEFNYAARAWHGADPRELPPQEWAQYFDLYDAQGQEHLRTEHIPLVRAWKGESVRDARIVIRARNQAPRHVSCNADPLYGEGGKLLGAVCVMHDVTQLMAAQDEARLEGQRFAGAFSSASQGMALVSTEGRWLEVNDALCAMFGYTREEMLTVDFQRLTHPEDLDVDLQLVQDVLAGRRASYQLDKRYFHRSGRTIHAHLSVSLVKDAKGEPLHFVSQIHDLSQRYQAEQRLKESEQRLRSVLEHSYDAFISVDEQSNIVEWNRAAEATFGWRRSEVLGKAMAEVIIPPHLRQAHQAGMLRYLQTGESRLLDQRLQMRAWHRSGHEFPIEMTISVVQSGAKQLFNAFMHDITDRVAAEEKLRTSEQRLRTVADNVPALIGHVGSDLRYMFVNQAYADWFSKSADEIVGRHMSEVLRPEHFEKILPRLQEVMAGKAVSFDMDVVNQYGEPRHMHASYIPDTREGLGSEGSFHLMVHDVTAQTRLARVMEQRALTDELTGLPNRSAWTAELARGMAKAQQDAMPLAVMFIDLNDFKRINDVHGHAAGDEMLREFAHRMRATLRTSDFIARLAGDEFVVLLESLIYSTDDLAHIAHKLHRAMAEPMHTEGLALEISPAIGFSLQDGPDFDLALLMRQADEAMYEAKRLKDITYAVRSTARVACSAS